MRMVAVGQRLATSKRAAVHAGAARPDTPRARAWYPNTLRTLRSVSSGTIVLRSAAIALMLIVFGRRGILNPGANAEAGASAKTQTINLNMARRRGWIGGM